jgi:hypothetical protein
MFTFGTRQDSGKDEPFSNRLSKSPTDFLLVGFKKSIAMDYEKLRDGLGYHVAAIKSGSPEERRTNEQI